MKKSVALLTYVVVDYPGGGGANAAKTCYEKVRKHTDRNPYARQGLCGGAWAAMEPLESRPRSRSARASALWASLPLLVRPLRIGIAMIHCAMCHTCDVGPARAAGGEKMALGAYRGYKNGGQKKSLTRCGRTLGPAIGTLFQTNLKVEGKKKPVSGLI